MLNSTTAKIIHTKATHMSDNKNIKDGRDTSKVSGEESYELSYLEEKFGVSRETVREAIKQAGNNREAVEAYLQKEKG